MYLTQIQDPALLKSLDVEQLDDLAQEIRSFLIQSISKTGGHLASNLGVIELTIALHYVFESPIDKIFFDVGHQAYTHKILTGRLKDFPVLRQFNGLSGFEKRNESIHDVWEAGHSSTSLSAALGMAAARDLNHDSYQIVPVIGDGALGSGMALEALNQIGSEKKNMVIIFNDNDMSISSNVGAMTKSFARLRSAKTYNHIKNNMKDTLTKSDFGKVMYTGLKNVKDLIKNSVIDRGIFGEFNLEYLGPVDGHNIRDLIQILNVAKIHQGPVVVHVITKKGKGYAPCENDLDGHWHGVGAFDIETGKSLASTPDGYLSWSKTMSSSLEYFAEKDENVVAITPAMINGSALNSFFAKYPERSFDCGIAEEHAATFSAGLAISNKKPYLAIYSSFLQRAYDQINHDICRMDLPVVIGVDRAGLVGADGETHHGVFDVGILKPLPNIIICQPKDADEAHDLLYTGFMQEHPFVIRYPRGEVKLRTHDTAKKIEIGTWEKLNDNPNNKIAIFAYGPDVLSILNKVEVNHLSVTVINCRFFKPLDDACISEMIDRNMKLISYETDMKEGGLGSSLVNYINDHHKNSYVHRIGIDDTYVRQGSVSQLRKEHHIDILTLFDYITCLISGE